MVTGGFVVVVVVGGFVVVVVDVVVAYGLTAARSSPIRG